MTDGWIVSATERRPLNRTEVAPQESPITVWRFLVLLCIRPREAFERGVGRFLPLSVVFGVASGLAVGGTSWLYPGEERGRRLLLILLGAMAEIVVSSLLIHFTALGHSRPSGNWRNLLSLYGFAALPATLSGTLMSGLIATKVLYCRSASDPGFIRFGGDWLIVAAAFYCAIRFSGYIYQALMVRSVYGLSWRNSLATMVIVFVLQTILIAPIGSAIMNSAWVSLRSTALMVDGVTRVDSALVGTTQLSYHRPNLSAGETVLVRIDDLPIRSEDGDASTSSSLVVGDLVGLPGDTVELRAGTLWINERLTKSVEGNLANLNMPPRRLQPDEYFVYFRSPQALGSKFRPSALVIHTSQVLGALSSSTVDFLQWLLG